MGKHNEWRKFAKRERRRKIRIQKAKERDLLLHPDDELWLQQQEELEQFEYEQIEKTNQEENYKWLQAEQNAIAQWNELQERIKIVEQEKLEKEAKLRQEWEEEKKRRKEAEEKLKQIEEEKLKKHEVFMQKLNQFLSGDCREPPAELLVSHETKPDCEPCPFFEKTACCRFGDQCSRNHKYPGISNILLATNFFTHFGLENSQQNEYDTDVMLEYEDSETYRVFKEFFYDVLPEFEKFGRVVQFKVCYNAERHLRGNVLIQFQQLHGALAAYRALHARWYAGKRLALRFCNVRSWKNAICGLQSRKKCPKGRACNFLHVFKNPDNMFNYYTPTHEATSNNYTPVRYSTHRSSRVSWRWSESPEPEDTNGKKSKSSDRDRRRSRETHRNSSYRKRHKSKDRSSRRKRSDSRDD